MRSEDKECIWKGQCEGECPQDCQDYTPADDTEDKACIWKGQCEGECPQDCQDYTPTDDTENNENFYSDVLKENAEVYQKEIDEYSGRRLMEYESFATAEPDAEQQEESAEAGC